MTLEQFNSLKDGQLIRIKACVDGYAHVLFFNKKHMQPVLLKRAKGEAYSFVFGTTLYYVSDVELATRSDVISCIEKKHQEFESYKARLYAGLRLNEGADK